MYWEARSALYPDETDTKAEEINLETIGQFTGLHDAKGREIYEGDILRRSYGRNHDTAYEISFSDGHFQFLVRGKEEALSFCQLNIDSGALRVIGNIYETPELLK